MLAKVVAIGTSKGIRLPKYLIDKYELTNKVDLTDTGSGILIKPTTKPRAGWEEMFKKGAQSQADDLIDLPNSEWDETQWEW